jgi:hypothetical protein
MCLIPSLHLFDVKERQSCIASALEYFKGIEDSTIIPKIHNLIELVLKSAFSQDQVRVGKTEG